MKKLLLLIFLLIRPSILGHPYISYNLPWGRFGDCLLCYMHAKWFSFLYDVPLRYRPFHYSNQLILHEKEILLENSGQAIVLSRECLDIDINKNGVIYLVPYFSEDMTEHVRNPNWISPDIDWAHPGFKAQLRQMVAPARKVFSREMVFRDNISVAVHIRTGLGFDPADIAFYYPLKAPPVSFYIEQIKKVSAFFNHANLYVHVFTDDPNPGDIIALIKSELANYNNIRFGFREKGNSHDTNVLDDFFSLTAFDCLIRSQSNYSLTASKLGDYLIEIFPFDYHYDDRIPIIDSVKLQTKYTAFVGHINFLYKKRDHFLQKKRMRILHDRPSSYPFISGDSFRALSDHLYDETDRSLCPENVKEGDIVFLKTDYMPEFFERVHPRVKHRYILITHNSDYGAPGRYNSFLQDDKIIRWFGINPTISDNEKFIPIPIGVANPHWKHGNIATFNFVLDKMREFAERNIMLGINFLFTTQERKPLFTLFSERSFCQNISSKDHETYLLNMGKTKFVLSPEGNGLDCHRTWEALIMGAIPVVRRSSLDSIYKELPVVIVDDWSEVSEELLHRKYKEFKKIKFNYDKLAFDYWSDLIRSERI